MKSQFIARKLLKSSGEEAKEKGFPTLRQMAIQTIAQNFEMYPSMDAITSPQLLEEIYAKISIRNTSIALLAKSIGSEEFWKRACSEMFSILDSNFLEASNGQQAQVSSKQTFFEIYFKRIAHEESVDPEFLLQMGRVAGGLIRKWSIEEVTEKLEKTVFECLLYMEKLEHLTVSFACPLQEANFGIDSYRGLNLERADMFYTNSRFANLKSLKLENNLINDKVLKVLLKSLKVSKGLTSLSLAHNKLGDSGSEVICHWLKKHSDIPVKSLDLSDNEIGYEGGRLIAQYLGDPDCGLEHLNLKINFLSNAVLAVMLQKINKNEKSRLKSLNLGSNLIKENQFENLRDFLTDNASLEELLLDGNEIILAESQVGSLQSVIAKSPVLKRFSIKFNKMDAESVAKLQKGR